MTRDASPASPKAGVPTSADHVPPPGTQQYKLLAALLKGVEVDPGYAFLELNVSVPQARCSELRKLGWPIRTLERPHPKLPGETMTVYLLDSQFRRWLAANPKLHPREYPVQDGRGKFASPGA